MDYTRIIELISKGMSVIAALYQATEDAWPAITALKDFVSGVQTGEITDEQFKVIEDLLDSLIAEFNLEV